MPLLACFGLSSRRLHSRSTSGPIGTRRNTSSNEQTWHCSGLESGGYGTTPAVEGTCHPPGHFKTEHARVENEPNDRGKDRARRAAHAASRVCVPPHSKATTSNQHALKEPHGTVTATAQAVRDSARARSGMHCSGGSGSPLAPACHHGFKQPSVR